MDLDTALRRLAREPSAPFDLAELALLLARDEYPNLDVEAHLSELAGMAREARSYLRGRIQERVAGLCRYLFHDMGFRGNVEHYYDARNSYLNQVLERRTGIPITLSAVAMTVGQRAGLEVVGVGLPGHFIVKAVDHGEEVLFDPFHGGRQLLPEEAGRLVERLTGLPFPVTPQRLRPTPLAGIVQRLLNNLRAIYLGQRDFPRALRVLERLQLLAPHDSSLQRDLGLSWLALGHAGRALGPLAAYLHACPQADDATAIRQAWRQAQSEVARCN
ncbi:MAG: transglutaminase-like domain-containing protein [Gemmataceae bacterium]|nr:transglutaminase-like domain-containing protein [Gemmataceae bacterium]MDW8266787.1 transglutaminase-like domain-containing protein [Gemmataceae bacterium]